MAKVDFDFIVKKRRAQKDATLLKSQMELNLYIHIYCIFMLASECTRFWKIKMLPFPLLFSVLYWQDNKQDIGHSEEIQWNHTYNKKCV